MKDLKWSWGERTLIHRAVRYIVSGVFSTLNLGAEQLVPRLGFLNTVVIVGKISQKYGVEKPLP